MLGAAHPVDHAKHAGDDGIPTVEQVLSRPKDERRADDLAQALIDHHPDGLPIVVMRNSGKPSQPLPLAEVLVMRNGWHYNPMLPAVATAYGNLPHESQVRQAVGQEMSKAFDKLLREGRYVAFRWGDELWNAMHFWGDQALGPKIWGARCGMMGGGIAKSMLEKPDITLRLRQLHEIGADLAKPCFQVVEIGGKKSRYTVMQHAVVMTMPQVVGTLLALGISPDGGSAAVINQLMEVALKTSKNDRVNESRRDQSKQIHEMLRSYCAREQAMKALAEIEQECRPQALRMP